MTALDKRDFDAAAATWDETPRRVRLAEDICAAIRAAVPLCAKDDLLDLGCGTGLVSLCLRPLVRSVTGADSSPRMLEVLEAKARAAALSNVRTLVLDLAQGEALPGLYHVAVSSMTLHHLPDVPGALRRLFDALHPGAHVALADLAPDQGQFHDDNTGVHHFGFEPEQLSGWLRDARFEEIRITTATRVHKEWNGQQRDFEILLAVARRPR